MLDTLRSVFTDNWIAWAYQYAVGGLFFWLTFLLGLRARAVDLASRRDRLFAAALVAGLLFFACAHAAWIWAVHGPPGAVSQKLLDRSRE